MANVQVDTYVDVAQVEVGAQDLRQELIYDARYRADGYDQRSQIRVLRAESDTLLDAVARVFTAGGVGPELTLFDFGYGTGRVTNEFADGYLKYVNEKFPTRPGVGLHIVGYDISSVGLQRAQEGLLQLGFRAAEALDPGRQNPQKAPNPQKAYVASRLTRRSDAGDLHFTLIHGAESATPKEMVAQVRQLVEPRQFDVVTSWYSALGHVQSSTVRQEYFAALSELTQARGELVVAVAATGDLVAEQADLKNFLNAGGQVKYPCESAQDLLYRTELGQVNFWHVFDTDLNAEMARITALGQSFWMRAIRFPDDEFETEEDELQNYGRVNLKNSAKRGSRWESKDFAECHTVAARRSGLPAAWSDPECQDSVHL